MNFIFPYKLVILIGIILLLSMFECGSGEHQKVKIESGTEYMVGYESCLFFTPEVGLMGGEKEGNACLWKTNDGGRHWQQQKLTAGILEDLTEQNGIVYATVEKREKDTLLYTHSIYTSFDQGESWQLKCEIVTEEAFIDLLVLDDKRMFIVLNYSLMETQNGGKEWQMVRNEGCRQISVDDKYLYYMISRISPEYVPINYLVRRSLKSGREQLHKFPAGVQIGEICGDVVLLRKERYLKSFRIEEDMSLTFLGTLKQQNYGVEYMSRQKEQLFVHLFVDIGLCKLFYSPNGGVDWKYVGKSMKKKTICMLTDSTHIRIFILDTPYYLRSYTHERIWTDK